MSPKKDKKQVEIEEIDPEIKEIFVEEAGDVLSTLADAFPRWQQNESDKDALTDTRRAFHTLKGSGRMVGAEAIGELAWSVESLLNKVLDGRIETSPILFELITAVIELVPSMVAAFEAGSGDFDEDREQQLREAAICLAEGKDITLEAGTASAQDEAEVQPEGLGDLDPTLVEIFVQEAGVHLGVLDTFVAAQQKQAPFYEVPSTALQAALHTLKGSAHMAGIGPIANLVTPLERFVKELLNFQIKVDDDSVELLADAGRGARQAVEALAEKRMADIAESEQLLARIAELRERMVAPIMGHESQQVAADPAFLNLLMNEGMQFVLESDATIALWQEGAYPATEQLQLMSKELRELEEGAGKAGFSAMALFSGQLAGLYERLQGQSGGLSLPSCQTLLDAHSRLLGMADAVAANQTVEQAPDALLIALTGVNLEALQAAPVTAEEIESELQQPLQQIEEPAGQIYDDLDAEVVELFFEEADELLESLEGALQNWTEAPDNGAIAEGIKRDLHTFKGGARMAGLESLGDLSHNFETLVIDNEGIVAGGETAPLTEMMHWYDRLSSELEGAKSGFSGGAKTALAEDTETVATPTRKVEIQSEPTWDSAEILPFTGNYKGLYPQEEAPKTDAQQTVEQIRIPANVLDNLVNLAGESSISRSQVEQNINEFGFSLEEMEATIRRMQDQVRRLAIETDAQVMFRKEQIEASDSVEGFDPLEMDRYSQLQQLSRGLLESSSDLQDLRDTLVDKSRDAESLLLQQSRINTDLQEGLMRTRMVPFSRIVPRLRRVVRQVSTSVGKQVNLELGNLEGELDRSVLERIVSPLEHMIRNAIDHGIEASEARSELGKSSEGVISLSFAREGGDVLIRIADDGKGLDVEAIREKAFSLGLLHENSNHTDSEIAQFIFHPGFSTSKTVTQTSGRGVGMDVVNSEVRQLGGTVTLSTQRGAGTEFQVRLPFTVSVNRALMIELGEDSYALALNSITGVTRMSVDQIMHYYQNPSAKFEYGGESYDVRYLGSLLSSDLRPQLDTALGQLPIVLIRADDANYAVQVDALIGSREIVVKTLGIQFSRVPGLSGATVLGDGRVVVILDLQGLLRDQEATTMEPLVLEEKAPAPVEKWDSNVQTIMVVDDSVTVRKVTGRFLEREGFRVVTAKDGVDAMRALQDMTPDMMLLDIEMPRMDGFEVARLVRSTQRLKDLPIIMITSRTGDKHRERALSMGVNRYLGKPYQEEVLIREVYDLLTTIETA